MRIYYFGELIQDTENPTQTDAAKAEQTKLAFEETFQEKAGMQSIGEILQELDLYHDAHLSASSAWLNNGGGLNHA